MQSSFSSTTPNGFAQSSQAGGIERDGHTRERAWPNKWPSHTHTRPVPTPCPALLHGWSFGRSCSPAAKEYKPGRGPAADVHSALLFAPHGLNNPVKYIDPSGHYTCSDIYCHGGPSIRFRYGKGGPVSGGVRKEENNTCLVCITRDDGPNEPTEKASESDEQSGWKHFCNPNTNCEVEFPFLKLNPLDIGLFRIVYAMSASTTYKSLLESPLTVKTDGLEIGRYELTVDSFNIEAQNWVFQTKVGEISVDYGSGLDGIHPITYEEVNFMLETKMLKMNVYNRIEITGRPEGTIPIFLAVLFGVNNSTRTTVPAW